jgi:hypothetical protein
MQASDGFTEAFASGPMFVATSPGDYACITAADGLQGASRCFACFSQRISKLCILPVRQI